MMKNHPDGRVMSFRYIVSAFIGSFILGMINISFGIDNLYGASGSDHNLLWVILVKGILLLSISIAFSFVLYRAVWLQRGPNGGLSFIVVTLACIHFLAFTATSALVIGSNVYRSAEGLITRENQSSIGNLDD